MNQTYTSIICQRRAPILIVALAFLLITKASSASDARQLVEQLGLAEVATTLDNADVDRCLGGSSTDRAAVDLREQALLSCLGLHGDAKQIQAEWDRHPVYSLIADAGEPNWLQDDRPTVEEFEERLIAVIDASLSTGYNISPLSAWPLFDPERTVIYGHTNRQHVRQLLALLQTEGLQPRIDLIQKKSSFVFRDSWGEPSRPLRQLSNGKRVASGIEFDVLLEFDSTDDIQKFATLVTRYAKKDEKDEPGLLLGSYWQPFYRTLIPYEGAHEIAVILITYQGYRANLTSLPDEAVTKLEQLRQLYPDWQVEPVRVWVNPGFFRFLHGDYR